MILLAWLFTEAGVRLRLGGVGGSSGATRVRDRGSFWVILLGLGLGLGSANYLSMIGIGGNLPSYAWTVGAALAMVGIGVRSWAIAVLGRYFSLVVRLLPEHRLVRNGPYRSVRHPAYTGAFLAIVGLAIVFGSILGTVVCAVLTFLVFLYRIRVEERLLRERFGDEYVEYSRESWRILPGVY